MEYTHERLPDHRYPDSPESTITDATDHETVGGSGMHAESTIAVSGLAAEVVTDADKDRRIADLEQQNAAQAAEIAQLKAALAVSESARKEAERLSMVDTRTGMRNRDGFREDTRRLATEISAASALGSRRGDTPRVVLVITADVDNFKYFNDAGGEVVAEEGKLTKADGYYDVGDPIIDKAAEFLRNSISTRDTAYHIGGDEFAVLAPVAAGDEDETFETIVDRYDFLAMEIRNMAERAYAVRDDPEAFAAIGGGMSVRLADCLRMFDVSFGYVLLEPGAKTSLEAIKALHQKSMDDMKARKAEKHRANTQEGKESSMEHSELAAV